VSTLGEREFAELTEPRRRELHVHCYRMLASFDEAEDAVQETFLRAWKARGSFDGSTLFRAWLYKIATNVCLDVLRSRRRVDARSYADLPWLQPYPDTLLDEAATPEDAAVSRETISLAFLAALQVLPARQRAALIARDVLGWPAVETAALLETSVAAANSALQRARATMQATLSPRRSEWMLEPPSPEERELLDRFMDAHERCDVAAALAVAAEDIRVTMPPLPMCFDGIDAVRALMQRGLVDEPAGDWRLVPTSANRMPTAASYLRRPGDTVFRAFKLDALRIEHGRIAEITTFGWSRFADFGLPPTL
jgi:RNA polymerase sigma-70 factor (ECF subfamily)